MIELRTYQQTLHDNIRASMERGNRSPLAVSPCGSGKTVLFCDYAKKVSARGKRTMILSHREELVEQISDTLTAFGLDHSFIAAGRRFRPDVLTQVASIATLGRRLGDPSIITPDLIIPDEAHHSVAGTWKRVFDHYPTVRRIGVTATACRLSGEPLGSVYDDIIMGPTYPELLAQGALSPYVVIAPPVLDFADLRPNRSGDFDQKAVKKARKPTVVGDAVDQYVKHAAGKRAVVFEVSVEEAKNTAQRFSAAGFRAACIDGGMDKRDRKELVQMFRDGYIDILTTCDLVSEGFDLPAIEVAICLRPTASLSLWIQQFGRALRPYPGKECAIILDHAGNTMRHLWLPESEVEWSLEGKPKIKGATDSGPSVRTCPFCHAAQFNVRGEDRCKVCGTVYGVTTREAPKKVAGELVPIDASQLQRIASMRRIEQGRAQTFPELVEVFRQRGEKNPLGHARHVWEARIKKAEKIEQEKRAKQAHQLFPQEV